LNSTTGDYVNVPNLSFISAGRNAVTVSFWIKLLPSTPTFSGYFIMSNDFGVWIDYVTGNTNCDYVFAISVPGTNSATAVVADISSWVHITGSFDGTNIRIYLNGVLAGTTSNPGTITNGGYNLSIGQFPVGTTPDCMIDDFRIYNRVLSDTEIMQVYNYHN
jgi:hypothetical protein